MKKRILISSIITLVLGAIIYYFSLPPINFKSELFWGFLLTLSIVFLVSFFFSGIVRAFKKEEKVEKDYRIPNKLSKKAKTIIITCVGVVLVGIGVIFATSSQMCNATDYHNLLNVKVSDFNADISEISLSQIPVVDRDTATRLGSRKIGDVVELVSQFNVSEYYTQINYNSKPTRVSPLEYADMIKWFGNREEGIPYYIRIDMANLETELVKLDEGMKYLPSEYFDRDLMRHVRFSYPTKMFQSVTFEVDDNGRPFWNVSYYDYTIGLFGGKDIAGIITVDAITGEMTDYAVEDVPQWVDTVYDAEMLIEQANMWGAYGSGYWNSVFGQKNVVRTTDGYNYIALDDDVWMYTGVTSVVDDASNIGFVLINLRTKEARQYIINGAEENSAMESAKGMIQEKNYTATFPILVNIADTPSYFISLKDNAGLVKAYSFVSVADYQIVGVGDTIEGAANEYKRLLGSLSPNKPSNENKEEQIKTEVKSIKVAGISSAVVSGNSVYYIKAEDGTIYTALISVSDNLPFVAVGDELKITINLKDNTITKVE